MHQDSSYQGRGPCPESRGRCITFVNVLGGKRSWSWSMLLDGETNLSGRTVSSAEFMYIMIRFVVGSGGIQIVPLMLFTLRDHIDISNKDLVTAKLWMAVTI